MRRRLTWTNQHVASAPPATPGYEEPSVHPAAYPDPEADQYENGDTSSWAEDPRPGPYPNTPHPALPGTEAPQGHPATDPAHYFPGGVNKQAAAQLRKAMEVKASKCIRIAQAMLGPTASVEAVEDQALDFMNLSEMQIKASLDRLSNYTLTEPRKGEDLLVEDDDETASKKAGEEVEEEDEEEEETAGKKAAKYQRLASYWTGVAKKAGEVPEAFKAQWDKADKKEDKKEDKAEDKKEDKKASRKATAMPGNQNDPEHYNYRARGVLADDLEASDEDEALLAEMLEEEAKKASSEEDEDEALLAEMIEEEAKKASAKASGEEVQEKADEAKAKDNAEAAKKEESAKEAAATRVALDPEEEALLAGMLAADEPAVAPEGPTADLFDDEDPMGLMDDAGEDLLSDSELDSLYAGRFASEEETVEEKTEEKKEETKKEASKVALHPQPRRASTGVRTLGNPAAAGRTASSEINDLSKLWATSPDVSSIFGK